MRKALVAPLLAALVSGCGSSDQATSSASSSSSSSSASSSSSGAGGSGGADPSTFIDPPTSCAFDCPPDKCDEAKGPYACQNLAPWDQVPHAAACGAWDGKFPSPQKGVCKATAPQGEAAKYSGVDPDDPTTLILPTGARVKPAGAEWAFAEADLDGGLTTAILAVPGTTFALTVDAGYGAHAVRVVDASLVGTKDPVVSVAKFLPPSTLNAGIALGKKGRVFVATDDGKVQALALDAATGSITIDDAKSVALPPSMDNQGKPAPWYVSGVAVSPDGTKLVVTGVFEKSLLVYDVDEAGATYGKMLGSVDLGKAETFGVWMDSHDPTGHFAYTSLWADKAVAEIDLTNPAAPKVARSFAVDRDPEGLAFLDARWVAVANDFGDTIGLLDRVTGNVTSVPVDTSALHGFEPSTLAWDEASKRLYATLAAVNAVEAWSVDTSKTPPTVTPLGRLGTSWWPGGVAVMDDGSLVVANMRGRGVGATATGFGLALDDHVIKPARSSIQHVPAPTMQDLASGQTASIAANDVGALTGHPTIDCGGKPSDFPVPATNTEGASKILKHVIFIVRENKTYDGLLGDFKGANGKPDWTLKGDPAAMQKMIPNLHALAKAFSIGDNYYTGADFSTQGHIWATHGRTSDFDERTWAMDGDGRSARPATDVGGVAVVGKPEEGSMFDWLGKTQVPYVILGEGVGLPDMGSHSDLKYPGGFIQNIGYPDVEKACYLAGRLRVLCDLPNVVYMTLPNDHTVSVGADKESPEVYIAVNDDATGMVVDAISHSPLWQDSLVIVTEDDPSTGGDHVDQHRTLFLLASPWVKRGYVSTTHLDVSSVHKLIAHVFGVPYPNVEVATAALPLDAFTSTPDYTPYDRIPRTWPLECGVKATEAEKRLGASFDLSDVDKDIELDEQVMRWMRGKQLEKLTPELESFVARRELERARERRDHDD